MFSITYLLLVGLFASQTVLSAPMCPLDAATLLQNGQDAQILNAEFQNLTITDPCTCECLLSSLHLLNVCISPCSFSWTNCLHIPSGCSLR